MQRSDEKQNCQEFKDVGDALSFLFRSASGKRLSNVEATKLFNVVSEWFKKAPGYKKPVYTAIETDAHAHRLLTELRDNSFRSLGEGEQYWVKGSNGSSEWLMKVSDIRDLLIKTYPQMAFLGKNK